MMQTFKDGSKALEDDVTASGALKEPTLCQPFFLTAKAWQFQNLFTKATPTENAI
eukprot:m.102498 g.102498  ORF g.102498 m.102498 type:complete len:55 (-) comp15190_c0_seq62:1004-1168(-)